jgi:hypothetical protein
MPDLAFHLGPGPSVVADPVGVSLVAAGVGEALLVTADADAVAAGGTCAVGAQRAVGAGGGEGGGPVPVPVPVPSPSRPRRMLAVFPAGQVTVSS